VRIYKIHAGKWEQLGQDLYGEGTDDNLPTVPGLSLSADGLIVAIGTSDHDSPLMGEDSGMAKVFRYNGTEWIPMGQKIEADAARDKSGYGVELSADGSILAVTSVEYDGMAGTDSGGVRTFKYNEIMDEWEQVGPVV